MDNLTLIQPDDWHLHVRSGDMLKQVIAHTARQFGRAIIMPNLKPAVTRAKHALAYRDEILAALPENTQFKPLMTLYLTDNTQVADVLAVAESEDIVAFKLYPAGATTNSDSGVSDLEKIFPLLERMEKEDVPLLIHGEVTDSQADIFDRERLFLEQKLSLLLKHFPALRIVLEHVTTEEAVQFVEAAPANLAATITPQHLLFNRNAILAGGLRPHYYCLPVLKREKHRQALLKAATSGNPKFFLGTDSAPHPTHLKENACGCAGCYSAHAALELYAEAFEQVNALDKLEAFASFHGPDFYQLPRNQSTIALQKKSWTVPDYYAAGQYNLTPLKAGETLNWQLV
jgi:dihydroorotase